MISAISKHRLVTVGHSNRSADELLELLKQNRVTAVADVRSHPYSQRFPHFNAGPLKAAVKEAGIDYVFLGDQLGARRKEPECYIAGQARYDLIAQTDEFKKGLDRVRRGLHSHSIALLCAEKDPLTCHRMVLVCRHLRGDCEITHLLELDAVEDQRQAELRLVESVGLPTRHLFATTDELIEQAYDIQGEKIAYRGELDGAPTVTTEE